MTDSELVATSRVVPANHASWQDLQTVLRIRGSGLRCQCQRYKLRPKEAFANVAVEDRADRLRQQTDAGHPDSSSTSGLVAYLQDEPVGWCAVEPRPAYPGLRHSPVPWANRAEDADDTTVRAVPCIFVRAGYRKRGTGRSMLRTAVGFAEQHAARALEGYPMTTSPTVGEELHVGTRQMLLDAGFTEVGRPTARRPVMRIDF